MSAPIRQISLLQAPVFVLNSRLGLSCATGWRSRSKSLHILRLSLSLSYGYNLPSSLTRVVPRTLGFSPRLPVSVSVRAPHLSLEAFLDSMAHLNLTLPKYRLSISSRSYTVRIYLYCNLPPSTRTSIRVLKLPSVSLHCSNDLKRYRNINLLSIAYAFCLGLGPDLPWVDERCSGNLRLSVEQILTVLFATHTGILSCISSSAPSGTPSVGYTTLPYPEL